jgi:tRNA threonylcarbamoyladenosine biosynthesis protein TsaB
MKLLAIDSSGLVASVAIATEDALLAEYTINYKKTHSQTLLPMLDEIVKMVELNLNDIDAIAITSGPGSFTGLRIGSATVKGLALALDKPIIPIPTLDAMAYNLYGTDKLICPMMDARRNQVYTGFYEYQNSEFQVVCEQKSEPVEETINELNVLGREVIFLGDGVEVYLGIIEKKAKFPYQIAPIHMSRQRAGTVASLGFIYYKNNILETAKQHQPVYLRLSQAEREREEKLRNSSQGMN